MIDATYWRGFSGPLMDSLQLFNDSRSSGEAVRPLGHWSILCNTYLNDIKRPMTLVELVSWELWKQNKAEMPSTWQDICNAHPIAINKLFTVHISLHVLLILPLLTGSPTVVRLPKQNYPQVSQATLFTKLFLLIYWNMRLRHALPRKPFDVQLHILKVTKLFFF